MTEATLNPWLSIWTKPRATIQQIVDHHPERYVLVLAALAGISQALDRASVKGAGDELSLPVVLISATVGGTIGGVLMLYLYAVVLRWSSAWLGGSGPAVNIRAALAWSSVPTIWALSLWVPQFVAFGNDLFTSTTPRIDGSPFLYLSLVLVQFAIAIWSLVVFFKCLGQVQGFSAWRALGATLLGTLVVFVPVFLVFFVYKLAHG